MLAPRFGIVSVARSAGCLPRVVPPFSARASLGLKARAPQSLTWKRSETFAAPPSLEPIAPVTAIGSQEVGLSV